MMYICMLRGINVGGKKVPMAELRMLCEELKLKNVATYIQSGNVIFESSGAAKSIEKKLEKALLDKYKFEITVFVKTPAEVEAVIKKNPYAKRKDVSQDRVFFTFLMDVPAKENLDKVKGLDYPPDEYLITGRQVYIHAPISYGNSKLSNNFFESKLKVRATTRNLKTLTEMLKMAGG